MGKRILGLVKSINEMAEDVFKHITIVSPDEKFHHKIKTIYDYSLYIKNYIENIQLNEEEKTLSDKSLKELAQQMKKYENTLDNSFSDDWYGTSYERTKEILNDFLKFLSLEQPDRKEKMTQLNQQIETLQNELYDVENNLLEIKNNF